MKTVRATSATDGLSVIVPAHDEAEVLALSLDALVTQQFEGDLDIVVVANGCRDRTVALARSYIDRASEAGFCLRVCELATPSKTAALNSGDLLKKYPSTMYLDADVVLSTNATQSVYRALQRDGTALASPQLLIAPSKSPITRAYGRVWSRLPYMQRRVRGVGCYAVSAQGRQRWRQFPDLLADDRFVRLHFREEEHCVTSDASYTWSLPEGLRELIVVRARWLYGNAELRAMHPELTRLDENRHKGLVGFVIGSPGLWRDVVVFLAVYSVAWLHLSRRRLTGDRSWSRATKARTLQRSSHTTSAGMGIPARPPGLQGH